MKTEVETSGFQPENYDETLTLTALFDVTFSIDWIVEMADYKPSQILMSLETAVRNGWAIKEEAGCFLFVDLAKKRALRNLLDDKKKQQLNKRAVDILIRELEDNEQKPIALAHHLLELKNDVNQCKWLLKAGDLYRKSYDTEAALRCYTKILTDLASLKMKEANQLYAEVAIKYSKTSTARHQASRVILVLEEAIARSKDLHNNELLPLLKMHLAKNEWLCSRYDQALEHFQNAWAKCNELKTPKLLRSAANFSVFFLYWQGRFRDSVNSYEEVVADVENYPKERFPILGTLTTGYCYTQMGNVAQGLGMLYAIQKICKENGDGYLECHARLHIGVALAESRHVGEAIHHLHLSVEQACKVHNDWVRILGTVGLAYVYFLKGNDDQSLSYLREYIQQVNKVHLTVRNVHYLFELSWAVHQGRLPQVTHLSLEEEIKSALRGKNVFLKGVAYRYKALLQKEKGSAPEKIYRSLKVSEKHLEKSGHEIELARTQLELTRHFLSLQRDIEAKEMAESSFRTLSPINGELFPADLRNLIHDSSFNKQLLKEILNLGQEIITIRDTKELIQKIMSTVNKLTGAERGAIFLTDDTQVPRVRLRASKNLTTREINHSSFESSIEMIEKVATGGVGLVQRADPSLGSEDLSEEIIRSRICVPMIYRNKVFGVLYHDNRLLSSAFSESDLELLSYFAALAAIAMDNARAYRKIENLNQKLKEEKLYYEQQALQSYDFDTIVGQSPAILKVLDQVQSVAKTDATVLIRGETGCGQRIDC